MKLKHWQKWVLITKSNILIGATHTINDLQNEMGYKAVFIGSGAGLPRFLNIPGESMIGIYTANNFLQGQSYESLCLSKGRYSILA